jgi:hypothetical protein
MNPKGKRYVWCFLEGIGVEADEYYFLLHDPPLANLQDRRNSYIKESRNIHMLVFQEVTNIAYEFSLPDHAVTPRLKT